MKGKVFEKNLKLDDVTILSDVIKSNELNDGLLKKCGGASLIDGMYHYNIQGYNFIQVYNINTVQLILPPETSIDDLHYICSTVNTINGYKMRDIVGYWIDNNGKIIREINTVIEFETVLHDYDIRHFINIMVYIKDRYTQESTAFTVNGQLILI